MNYTKRGIKRQLKELNSTGEKIKHSGLVWTLKIFLIAIIAVGIFGVCAGVGVMRGILATVPEVELDDLMPNGYATMVYDKDGNLLQKLVSADANRTYVQSELIPDNLKNAFVAIEDERYYEHNGVDMKGIIRAAIRGIKNNFNFDQGASTITQQLLKNNVFTDWMSEDSFLDRITRKVQEQYLAIEISKEYDKDTLLTLYLNTINMGANTLGVQAASMRYFNKSVKDLTLSECAVLAGITQNPSRYNPITHPDYNKDRREAVLDKMLELSFITREEYDEAMADTEDVYSRIQYNNISSTSSSVNSYFVDAVVEQVMDDLQDAGYTYQQAYNIVYSSGAKIYTTMDSEIQAILDEEAADESNYPSNSKWYLSEFALTVLKADGTYANYSIQMLKAYFQQKNAKYNLIYSTTESLLEDIEEYENSVLEEGDEIFMDSYNYTPQPQISIVIEDQSTGYVLGMIGGRGTKTGSMTYNRATEAMRQPGSTFKVLSTYAPALDSYGMTLASVQTDAPFTYNDGTPVTNWWTGETYKGICSIRYAIEQSLNIIAVKNLTIIGPQLGYDYLLKFGFTTLVDRKTINGSIHTDITQSLALGGITYGVTNLELNAAYATIANGGTYIKPVLYTQLITADGDVLLDNTQPESRQVIRATTAYLLTLAMTDVVTKGTGTLANFDKSMAIAGKTGTTSKNVDIWFAGFTPYYTCTIWAGYDNNVSMNSSEEKAFHKKLWAKIMSRIHEDLPSKGFNIPANITKVKICSESGLLPIEGLCDSCIVSEYFEEGTEPTEYCNVHYSGTICPVDLLPASDYCPFSMPGVITMDPPLDESLIQGATIINEDGTVTEVNTTGYCQHTYEWFLQQYSPNYVMYQYIHLTEEQRNAVLTYHPDFLTTYGSYESMNPNATAVLVTE